jgi:hypothetical protein
MNIEHNVSLPPAAPFVLAPEDYPNLDNLIVEDDEPVESAFIEKLLRLLTEPIYNCWVPPEGHSVVVLANVGLFFAPKQPPLSPDVMLSLDAQWGQDLLERENRSYFVWERCKPPDVVIEFVSDRRGGEAGYKRDQYARIGVTYYVIFDPENRLRGGVLRSFVLNGGKYHPLPTHQFPNVHLGLTSWEGTYEGHPAQWLRWCDAQGQLIPTGGERIEQERQQRLAAEERAEQERQRAEQERQRREKLEARLRELGLEP